jgi:hypothetical protein
MNDTINFCLHDLKKHETILNSIRIINNGYRIFEGNQKGTSLNHDIIINDISRKEKERFIYRTQYVASSHYKIIITVDKNKGDNGIINFNFSIPKYFYGHNIAQSTVNTNELDFQMINFSLDDAINNGYNRLLRYIKTFFDNEFPACYVDYSNIELKRLDFCYNQIFRSKGDALEYLNLQKLVKKKHLRENSGYSNNYQTSIFYANDMYSVKIYHKGTEYSKNDVNEHERINRERKEIVFDVGYLQEFSDKILRYEITFRPSYISYIYNKYIFRKNSRQFLTWRTIHSRIKAINDSWNSRKFFETDNRNKQLLLLVNKYKDKIDKKTNLKFFNFLHINYFKKDSDKITDKMKIHLLLKFYKDVDILLNYRRRFYFDLNIKDRADNFIDNQNNDLKFDTFKKVKYTNELYILMANKLKEFIFDMRVETRKPTEQYLSSIDKYNETVDLYRKQIKGLPSYSITKSKSKLDKPKLGLILIALENSTIDNLQNRIGFSRATLSKYKKDLKTIGYEKNSVSNIPFEVPDIDFKQYYIETSLNQYKFFINQFFRLKDI